MTINFTNPIAFVIAVLIIFGVIAMTPVSVGLAIAILALDMSVTVR